MVASLFFIFVIIMCHFLYRLDIDSFSVHTFALHQSSQTNDTSVSTLSIRRYFWPFDGVAHCRFFLRLNLFGQSWVFWFNKDTSRDKRWNCAAIAFAEKEARRVESTLVVALKVIFCHTKRSSNFRNPMLCSELVLQSLGRNEFA